LLRQSDFVSIHAALTPENHRLIGAAQLKLMKPTAVLVNTARGPLVDQAALYEALTAGTIFAAGLDVTDPEPPDPADPLLQLPNVVVAPHLASATYSTRDEMATICAANLIAGLTGQPLPAWVNPDVAARRRPR
jgi:glyoxylate reductase